MSVTYGSLFAGAGGVDLGFDAAGWSCRWQVEIDPTATAVLERHWHDAARHADVCAVDGAQLEPVDVISGGFPCQDLSVAGHRAGLDGARSGLFYEFVRIVKEMRDATDGLRPRWVVWENVAGLLSTRGALATVYARWDEIGAVVQEHRLVDGRYFGVPQRRRRVIGVVGFDPRSEHAPEILIEREGVRRDIASGGQAWSHVAALTANGVGAGGGPDDNAAQAGHLIPTVNNTLTAHCAKSVNSTADDGLIPVVAIQCHGNNVGPMGTLRAGNGHVTGGVPVVFNGFNGKDMQPSTTVTPTVRFANGKGMPQTVDTAGVRRLTPRECERLMGWPDDHTRYRPDGSEIADTHRYRMCGNGVIAPMAEWIARRITATDWAVAS